MGKNCSKLAYPPVDPIFQDIGCIGMLRYEYSEQKRLEKAPFFTIKFNAKDYGNMMDQMIDALRYISQSTSDGIEGPVYFAAAFDHEQNKIEAYLLFPNIQKTSKDKYRNVYERGVSNRWMGRLLTSSMYRVKPPAYCSFHNKYDVSQSKYATLPPTNPPTTKQRSIKCKPQVYEVTNPKNKQGDPISFMYGCRTDASALCYQYTRSEFKSMGIYDSKKKPYHYPNVFFHIYKLNEAEPRITRFIRVGSPTFISRNILPSELDLYVGCRYMLLSDNRQYCLALGNKKFGIYRNVDMSECSTNLVPVFERTFNGYTKTRLIVDSNMLYIYSEPSDNDTERQVFSMKIAPDDAKPPIALMLEDDGTLAAFDKNSKKTIVIDNKGQSNSSLTNTNGAAQSNVLGSDGFDIVAERKRRLMNLYAYLQLANEYIAELTGVNLSAAGIKLPPALVEDVLPPYDEKLDYIVRWNEYLAYLRSHAVIDEAMLKAYYVKMAAVKSASADSKAKAKAKHKKKQQKEQQADSLAMTDDEGILTPVNDAEALDRENKIIQAENEEAEQKKKENEDLRQEREGLQAGVDASIQPPPPLNVVVPTTPMSSQYQAAENARLMSMLDPNIEIKIFNTTSGASQTQAMSSALYSATDGFDIIADKISRLKRLGSSV